MAAHSRALGRLKFTALLVLSVVVLYGGFALLRSLGDSKAAATALAVAWGVGSVALLYLVLNMGAEMLSRRARSLLLPFVFAGPALALLCWFLVLPTLRTLWLSFFDETGTRFVFLKNYAFAFTDPIMLESFRNNLLWMIVGTVFCVGSGLVIAVLADRSKWEKAYKSIIFLPMAISFVGAGVIWKFVYAYKGEATGLQEIGLLNAVVVALGGHAQPWLLLGGWNTFLLIAIMVWLQTGYAMVIISSAIKGVPVEMLEAARMDGAGELRVFFGVIIPAIEGTLITVTTTIVIFSLKLFDIVRVMTGGNWGTNVIANEFYMEQFTYGQTGRASAIAVVLLVAVVPAMAYNLRRFGQGRAFK
jgi:alpha-glucoside transport system permease protein